MKSRLILALALACWAAPAAAQEKAAVKPGFAFPQDRPIRILVFRPQVRVGAQSAGGVVSPNAEWTASARANLQDALIAAKPGGAYEVVFMPELDGDNAAVLADYRALFNAVADTVLQHRLFKGDRLPTKKTGFEYSLGPGVARLGALGGGDYGLFLFSNDAYGSTGRKLLQTFSILASVASAGVSGAVISVTSGEHVGYAGLVDLKTGDLVWMNADFRMGGDVREREGATKRARELLSHFPGASNAAQAATGAK